MTGLAPASYRAEVRRLDARVALLVDPGIEVDPFEDPTGPARYLWFEPDDRHVIVIGTDLIVRSIGERRREVERAWWGRKDVSGLPPDFTVSAIIGQFLYGPDPDDCGPLRLPGGRLPASWSEAFWVVGTVGGSYLAVFGTERRQIRARDKVVETSTDDGPWQIIGKVE
jgi:hypothetical protein